MLEAGAFVAVERAHRAMVARLRAAQRYGLEPRTNAAIAVKAWRSASGQQAVLASLLLAIDVRPVDLRLGQEAGMRLGEPAAEMPATPLWSPWLLQGPRGHCRCGRRPSSGRRLRPRCARGRLLSGPRGL